MPRYRLPLWLLVVLNVVGIVSSFLSSQILQVQAQSTTQPILIVVNDALSGGSIPPFGHYLGEILRAEGLNSFEIVNLSSMTANTLSSHNLTILARTPLNSAQATLFTNYVNEGGRLIAMRPDAQIKGLFGLAAFGGLLTNPYVKIDNAATLNGVQPGAGLPGETLQIHGTADGYAVTAGTIILAQLYSNATQASPYGAVISSSSGRAIAFNFDLAENIIYTRQGNPANANIDVDGDAVLRTIDLFQSQGGGAPWIDRTKIPLPQADIQQRFFARLVSQLVGQVRPLPQLWYFPGQAKTMLILTSDAHGNLTSSFQSIVNSVNARNGKITFYISIAAEPNTTSIQNWINQGHTVGIHPYWWFPSSYPPHNITNLAQGYDVYESWYAMQHNGLDPSPTVRNHQVAWQGWTDGATIAANHGYALDTNFYHWGAWIKIPGGSWPHGYITGSGQPMKFIRADGAILPIYQQLTQLVDEHLLAASRPEGLNTAQSIAVSRQLLDASQAGDYAAVMTQFHVDYWGETANWATGTMDYANSLGIPIWNADQLLSFTQTRHDAEFTNITWNQATSQLTFNLQAATNSNILSVLLPLSYSNRNLDSILIDGGAASYQLFTVSGRQLALVTVSAGNHSFAVGYGTPANAPAPTPTFTATSTNTPVPPTPTPTATSISTPTPTNTPGPSPTPTATLPPGSFPTTGVLDNFTRANGAIGNNWGGSAGSYRIASNQLDVISGGDIYWQGSSFGADQEAFVTFSTIDPAATEHDLILKAQGSTNWNAGLLEVVYEPAAQRVQVWTFALAQGWVQHGADIPVTFANGDRFGARATATGNVEVYRNGTLLAVRSVATWPYFANGGYIGLWFAGAPNAFLDDFGGGTASAAPTPTNTPVPPTATPTNTPTNTPVPPTATSTATPTNTPVPPTATPTDTPTNTAVPPTATATDTPTNTPVPPTATATNTPTDTPIPPTATPMPTDTPVLPTATLTNTPTDTPVPPTATATNTALPPTDTPTSTATDTPLPPTDTPTASPTNTLMPPTNTPVPPTNTPTNTSVPPTPTATNTPTNTPLPPSGFPSTAVLDSFTRANGPIGNNWRGSAGSYRIASNQLDVISGGDIYWRITNYGPNQEAFVTFSTIDPAATEHDLILKAQGTTNWNAGLLEVVYEPAAQRVQVWTFATAQGWVQHGADIPVTFANGDRFGARATATGSVEIYRNNTLIGTRNVSTWPYFANGGYIGLWFAGAPNAFLDDFGGGSFSAGVAAVDLPVDNKLFLPTINR